MKEKPILFSTPMVQALLNTEPNAWPAEPIDPGKPFKSQTRRVIDKDTVNQFDIEHDNRHVCGYTDRDTGDHFEAEYAANYHVGDVLWVRETFLPYKNNVFYYKADNRHTELEKSNIKFKWKPSIFMPRKAARLFLEVKSVRVERLQDITLGDVQDEGITMDDPPAIRNKGKPDNYDTWPEWKKDEHVKTLARHIYIADCNYVMLHINKFSKLWDSLNAKRGYSWESNPWVWVYEFMRVEK